MTPLLRPGPVASDPTSGFDLRLALGAAAAWLTLLGCRWCAPSVALTVAVCAGVSAAVVVSLGPAAAAPVGAVVGLGAWCVVGILVPYDVRLNQVRRSLPARLADERPTVVAEMICSGCCETRSNRQCSCPAGNRTPALYRRRSRRSEVSR
jgi:hypothetical protein